MEVWGLIISILALLASAFTYFKHDKKLKEQERKINEYQLKQIEKEDLESKKAAIRGNIVKGLKGKRTLKVYNSGRAIARNIRIEGLDVEGLFHRADEVFPYELMNPQDYTEVNIMLFNNCAPTIKLKYIWDDESGKNNEFEQVLTL
ncbi:MAG: hypothetical protein ACLSEC_03865 [Alistipes communis]|jgi:hypothetical protein|uniref:hypothetical protein n=1 Tax=Alistipes communis TaxID=2585118 RepID=UPI00399291EF